MKRQRTKPLPTLIHKRVRDARENKNLSVICKVPSGWVVLGDNQFLPGYSLLLPDPVVPALNDLKGEQRQQFLEDFALLGDAVLKVTNALRINYEILGNLEPALHAHVFPRYQNEASEIKTRPVWFYDRHPKDDFNLEKHEPMMRQIKAALFELYASRGITL